MNARLLLMLTAAVAVVGSLQTAQAQPWSYLLTHQKNSQVQTTLAIDGQGGCRLTNDALLARASLEKQIRSWERRSPLTEEAASETPAPAAATNAAPPALTREELAGKLSQMVQSSLGNGALDSTCQVQVLETTTNQVHLLLTSGYSSLEELLGQNVYFWGPPMLLTREARFESDTNSQLRISFPASENLSLYKTEIAQAWKASRLKQTWRLQLPGKVLSSDLPETTNNLTWLTLDADRPETIKSTLQLLGTSPVILAEAGPLRLSQPLVASKLAQAIRHHVTLESRVPLTEAQPGFTAEATGLTISSLHRFPDAEQHLTNAGLASAFMLSTTGTVVSVKLFPPKDRILKHIASARVLQATDDQGRAIALLPSGDQLSTDRYAPAFNRASAEQLKGGALSLDLSLGLPLADARTIQSIQAEAIALTTGGWKELTITNLQTNSDAAIDLSALLPGASLTIKKLILQRSQCILLLCLEGPDSIAQLEVAFKPAPQSGSDSVQLDQSSVKAGKTLRTLQLRHYEYGFEGSASAPPRPLIVRFPQDVRRERVLFTLTDLDLL